MLEENTSRLSDLKHIIDDYKSKNILLITGKDSYKKCGAKDKIEVILSKYNIIHFNDFETTPKLNDALRGAQLAINHSIDLIISIGGGSVIDIAKLVKAFSTDPNIALDIILGDVPVPYSEIPLVAIPTTAGSGSESTHFAVVYINDIKYSLADESLLPSQIILDGSLTISANRYQKACNVLDAMSQSIESAWAVSSSKASQEYAFKALEICAEVGVNFINSNNSIDYAQSMIIASNLAGKAINTSKTTSAHAWSYGFSIHHKIPHGHAVWITLPKIFKIHSQAKDKFTINDPRGAKHLFETMEKLKNILSISSDHDIEDFFLKFLDSIGINANIDKDFNLSDENKIFLSQSVNQERMSNNPIKFTQKQVNEIFHL